MDLRGAGRMFAKPQEEYKIWTPKRFVGRGRYSDTDPVKYVRMDRAEEVEYGEKSDLPAKEVLSPITQSLFYLIEDESIKSKAGSKKLLIFIRPCNIHTQHYRKKIYLTNDGCEDTYYKHMNEKVEITMVECGEGWDTCFCVSTGTNRTGDYPMAIRFREDRLEFQVKGHAFTSYFGDTRGCPFEPRFVERNELALTMPKIPDKEVLIKLREYPMRGQFNDRHISCGACTVVHNTCTCLTTTDIMYNENRNVGERKGTSTSCQIKDFIDITGSISLRNRAGGRMRYEVLHKSHSYKTRLKDYHMCVGRGRCMDRCPEYIFIMATVNKVADVIEEIKADRQAQEGGCSHE